VATKTASVTVVMSPMMSVLMVFPPSLGSNEVQAQEAGRLKEGLESS